VYFPYTPGMTKKKLEGQVNLFDVYVTVVSNVRKKGENKFVRSRKCAAEQKREDLKFGPYPEGISHLAGGGGTHREGKYTKNTKKEKCTRNGKS